MTTMRIFVLCMGAISLTLATSGVAQAADPATTDVDAIFADYDRTTSPGCSLGIIRDGELIHKRGYGMANLEYGIALSPRSVFRTASVGKQFTAMAIALLAERGTISLEDPLSKFFPEFPNWAETITLRHLVHHTSGIRDYLTLTWLAGMGDEAYYTDEFAIELLSLQKNLNFAPGDDYLYSNSGYLLLAHVVKHATGKTLREWAAENMFEPLGMENTHFHDDHNHIVPLRADGYAPAGEGFQLSMTNLDMVGDGGVYTTINDLLAWDRNFYDNKLGNGDDLLIKTVTTPGERNDGEPMHYAFGLTVREYRGLPMVAHGGAFVGFRADTVRFPEQRLSVFVLCNRADANPGQRSRQVAELYLEDLMAPEEGEGEPEAGESTKRFEIPPANLERIAGHYWSAEDREFQQVILEDNTLYLIPSSEYKFELVPRSQNHFALTTPWFETELSFASTPGDGVTMSAKNEDQEEPAIFERFDPRQLSPTEAHAYAGTYFSEELDVEYILEERDGELVFGIDRAGDHVLEAKFGELFSSSDHGLIEFELVAPGEVIAFVLDAGRVRNLRFVRQPL